jgi:hypothetical protein
MVGWVVVYFEIIDLNNGPGGFLAFLRQLTTDFTQLADMMVVLFWCEVVVQSYVFSYLKYLDGALALWKIIGISAFPLCAALILIAIGSSMREGFWIVALGVVCLCLFGMTFLGPLIMHSLYQLIPNKEDISGP